KPGAYFVKTARAEVVDHEALAHAVREKGLRVALDVFPNEPDAHDTVFKDSIVHLEGIVYGTHHIGASTDQAQDAVADEAFEVVKEYSATGSVRNCVNLSVGKSPKGVLVVRHRNRPGVLANVLAELSRAGINVREMENVICEGEEGAYAQIRLDSEPSSDVLTRIAKSDENILGITLTAAK
ncbi:MAG: ACT domain-containing protein, partial [Planctomycetes bacterium]|nr:ACT domain-containing protein [Planctomycetota bacterium]